MMKLETQIQKLAALGLSLNEGITLEDCLISHTRKAYEDKPFSLILFLYAREVEEGPSAGRFFCDRIWELDSECIVENGDYTAIVQAFHRISGRQKSLDHLCDEIDIDEEKALLRYTLDGQAREFHPQVNDDWADAEVIAAIMNDMRSEGYDFYGLDNGQATVWFYMTPQNAKELNDLAGNIFRLNKKPWWKIW